MIEIGLDSQSIIFVSPCQNSVMPYKMGHFKIIPKTNLSKPQVLCLLQSQLLNIERRKINIEKKNYREKEIENIRHLEKINEIIHVRLYN